MSGFHLGKFLNQLISASSISLRRFFLQIPLGDFLLPENLIQLNYGGDKKVKIGIFTECYHPVLNGVVVSIDTFKTELEKRGHEFFIFTTNCPGYYESNPRITRYACMLPFPPKGGRYPISWPQLARWQAKRIDCLNLDIIHSQHLLGIGEMGIKVGRILNLPTVLTYHTLLAEYTHYVPLFGGLVRRYLIRQSRVICNLCDQVVTPSPSMKKVLRSYGVTTPIESIPTGVDVKSFQNGYSYGELHRKWQIPKHRKILLYVSRIAKEKNIDFLIDSIKVLANKRRDFHLLMVGGGPELKSYENKIKHDNLDKLVTFTDMQPKKEVNRYYSAADIFVFPSVTETQGIVVTEAMAAGIPAVAVNKMGPSDIISDGVDGYLTPLKTGQFSAKIEQLLDDDEKRIKMGQQAKKNTQKFSVEKTGDQMEKLYEKLRNHHRS